MKINISFASAGSKTPPVKGATQWQKDYYRHWIVDDAEPWPIVVALAEKYREPIIVNPLDGHIWMTVYDDYLE